jgi:hypothetical protein
MRVRFTNAANFDAAYTLNAGASGTATDPNQLNGGNGDPVEYKVLGN